MHKINNSIDSFYKNSLKKESFQLFLIKDNWGLLTSAEIAKYSTPYDLTIAQNKKTLIIKTSAPSLASNLLYSQEQLFKAIFNLAKLEISHLKFITTK
mgnify:FL=1